MRIGVTGRLRGGMLALLALSSVAAGGAAPQVADAVKARDLTTLNTLL
jgi:hypothetical protein